MRLRSLMLVSAFSVLLTGCAAYTERQFIPDQRTADGVDAPDAPEGGGGDAGADAGGGDAGGGDAGGDAGGDDGGGDGGGGGGGGGGVY